MDAIVIPTGGGGMLAGIALVVKELRPDVQIIVCGGNLVLDGGWVLTFISKSGKSVF